MNFLVNFSLFCARGGVSTKGGLSKILKINTGDTQNNTVNAFTSTLNCCSLKVFFFEFESNASHFEDNTLARTGEPQKNTVTWP